MEMFASNLTLQNYLPFLQTTSEQVAAELTGYKVTEVDEKIPGYARVIFTPDADGGQNVTLLFKLEEEKLYIHRLLEEEVQASTGYQELTSLEHYKKCVQDKIAYLVMRSLTK